MIILYGDHYGLSDSEYTALAPLLGRSSSSWGEYDNIQEQKVPFMIHMSGLKGGINNEVGGEIDVLPTLLHLLGVNTKDYIQFGSDLLSPSHRQSVIFRNGTIVTPDYVIVGGKGIKGTVYNNHTGKKITTFTTKQKQEISKLAKYGAQALHNSDLLNNKNLLRFYTPAGFIPTSPNEFDYKTNYYQMLKIQQELGSLSTSLYSQKNGTTTNLYSTNAPESNRDKINKVPESVLNEKQDNKQPNKSSSSSKSK